MHRVCSRVLIQQQIDFNDRDNGKWQPSFSRLEFGCANPWPQQENKGAQRRNSLKRRNYKDLEINRKTSFLGCTFTSCELAYLVPNPRKSSPNPTVQEGVWTTKWTPLRTPITHPKTGFCCSLCRKSKVFFKRLVENQATCSLKRDVIHHGHPFFLSLLVPQFGGWSKWREGS